MKTGSSLIRLSSVKSTNQYASQLIAQQKAVNGLVVSAYEQTEGKGLDGNFWESMPGKNLTISILSQPEGLLPGRQFMLNKISSLAITDFIIRHFNLPGVRIKWPNDVYIGDCKIAGILINNTIEGEAITWSVIGIGLNVNQTVFGSNVPNPVSLKQLCGKEYDLDLCLKKLCRSLDFRFAQLLERQYKQIDADYFSALYHREMYAKYIYRGQLIEAKIIGIGEFGHLQLEKVSGKKLLSDLKEIKFVI